jgi:hypothetical protein
MKTFNCEQGGEQWCELHRGVPTASRFDRILTAKTMKLSAQADDLICDLIAELHYPGSMAELFGGKPTNRAMEHGKNTEAEARRWYELETDCDVQQVGFCTTDDGRFGFSPDGLIGTNGGLELKCPQGKTQVRYKLDGVLPAEYKTQVHGPLALAIIDPTLPFEWWDFVSYCPGLPHFAVNVIPDDYTKRLAEALDAFWERYQTLLQKIRPKGEAA